jgi:tetratricopeptide (TPR) repeat protein
VVYYGRVDSRVLILAIPSLVVFGLLVAHSLRTLPRGRAIAFWVGVVAYGVVRGVALRWVIAHGGGSSFPYTIRDPLFPVFGVPLQEVAGWAIVTYLGWWLGSRFSRILFVQLAWACLFLGAISWTVESAAVAAGWWTWTVPVTNPLFLNVPFIAIVDWFFVGADFLLPFLALTAPGLRGRPARFLAVLAFPLHFASHCFSASALGGIPIPVHHLAHWSLLAGILWLALRSDAVDAPFGTAEEERPYAWLPIAGLAVVLLDVAMVEACVVRQPELLVALLPTVAVALQALYPMLGYPAAGFLNWGRRHRRLSAPAVLLLVAVSAYQVHAAGARQQADLIRRLDAALAFRDRGDLVSARRELAALVDDFPGSHAPPALLGEIDYRTGSLDAARENFLRAVRIKQDDVRGYRYLAVIELRAGKNESAAGFADRGLAQAGADPELLYLAARARAAVDFPAKVELRDSKAANNLAALAFEVGDTAGAATLLDRGLALWPGDRALYPSRVNVALHVGDAASARRVIALWLTRFPQDAEARRLSQNLGMN